MKSAEDESATLTIQEKQNRHFNIGRNRSGNSNIESGCTFLTM